MYSRSMPSKIFDLINSVFLALVALSMIFPFYYVLVYSISNPNLLKGGLILWPIGLNIDSYKVILNDSRVLTSVLVSVARTISGPTLMIAVTSMAAYVLTRDAMPGVRILRKFFVFTMYMGAGLIPMYILVKRLGLIGTFWIYIIPQAVSVYNMILIKTYIESIPKSLEEAALIDGANDFLLFWRIIFPACTPVIAATALFSAVGHWNDFMDTQIYNNMNPELYTLQYMLYQILNTADTLAQAKNTFNRPAATPQSIKMATTMITILPIAAVYPFLQKYFAKGLLIGSIKG